MVLRFLIFILFVSFQTGQVTAQNLQPAEAREWRGQIRSALFVPETLPALGAEVHGEFRPVQGVRAERISYKTLFGMKVPAILYLPEPRPAGKIPAIFIVNGHGGDKYSWYAYYAGIMYAKAGAVVLTYDPIGEGERNIHRRSGTRAHDVRQDPPELGQRMGGLMMTEVMQAVTYLRERPEVDEDRIAAIGHSMGSMVMALAGAVETRLHAVVLSGGGNLDKPEGYWDNSKPMCQGIPYRSLSFLGDRPAKIYALHAARGSTLIYNGVKDSVVAVPQLGTWPFFDDLYQRTAALWGSTHGLFEYDFNEGGHRPNFLTKPVAVWLEKQLDFPHWTEMEINNLPIVIMSQWASENEADVDPGYASQQRAGGTELIAWDIPVLSRDLLTVYPREKWEADKHLFVYEAWLEAARAAVLANQ